MTEMEAIRARHTVRKYTQQALSLEPRRQLDEKIAALNAQHALRMRLITGDGRAFGGLLRLTLAKGVQNYLVLVGENRADVDEKLGYCGIQVALLAQRLGLNSWWVAGTYSRKKVAQIVELQAGEKLTGVIALGYGAGMGKPHKSKTIEQVSDYQGAPPSWFTSGVEAALLAPTALNRQAFHLSGQGGTVTLTTPEGAPSGADRGIIRYHFEVGAGTENFSWR